MQLPTREPSRQPVFESALYESGEARLLRTLLWDGLLKRLDDEPGGLTQTDAARRSGISRPSVKNYTRTIPSGILDQGGLALNPDAGYALGVDFARTHAVTVALTKLSGEVATGHGGMPALVPVEPEGEEPGTRVDDAKELSLSPPETVARAVERIGAALEATGVSPDAIVGIGIGLPTPSVGGSPTDAAIGHWRLHNPADLLRQELMRSRPQEAHAWAQMPIEVDNDTNLSAIANHLWGSSRSDHTVYVKWMAGLRAALILDGRLYRGSSGAAGELQHIEVKGATEECGVPRCGVGEGCIFGVAPIEHLRSFAKAVTGDPDILWADQIIRAASSHAELATRLENIASALGQALAPLARALNPNLIVIGGALGARAYPLILDKFGHSFESHAKLELGGTGDITVTNTFDQKRMTARGAAALALMEFGPAYLVRRAKRVRPLRRAG